MLLRTSHVVLEILAAMVAGLVLIVVVGAWQLSQGPVSLGFLKPYIDEALASIEGPLGVEIDDVILKWAGWDRALDIVVIGARARARSGALVASAPEVSVSLKVRELFRGVIAPTSLELIRPRLRMIRTEDGRFEFGLGQSSDDSENLLPFIGETLVSAPAPGSPLGGLRRVSIVGGRLSVRDRRLGISWGAPHADITISREDDGLRIDFDLDTEFKGQKPRLRGKATYSPTRRAIAVSLAFEAVRPDLLAEEFAGLAPLKGVHAAFRGAVELSLDDDGRLARASYDIISGEGVIDLPDPTLRGLKVVSIASLGRFAAADKRLEIDRLTIDLGGPKIDIATIVTGGGGSAAFDGEVTIHELPIDQLGRYWPPDLRPVTRGWVVKNMKGGMIHEGKFALSGRVALDGDAKVTFDRQDGRLEIKRTAVHYLRPLPPVREVDTTVVFAPGRVDVTLHGGDLEGLTLREGTIEMTGIDKQESRIKVEVVLAGGLDKVLGVLDHPFLGFAGAAGFAPGSAGGTAALRLIAQFPMKQGLSIDQVDLRVAASLKDVSLPGVAMGRDLSDGQLSLRLDSKGMSVTGSATFDGIPGEIAWYQNFGDGGAYRTRYDVEAVLDDDARRRFGLDTAGFLDGPVAAKLHYVVRPTGERTLTATLTLDQARLALPVLGWSKPAGRPAAAALEIGFADGRVKRVNGFDISTGELRARGSVDFSSDGATVSSIQLDHFSLGARTEIRGTARRIPDGSYVVVLSGPRFDADRLIGGDRNAGATDRTAPPFRLHAKFDRMWLGADAAVLNIESVLHYDGKAWRRISLEGDTGNERRFAGNYVNQGGVRNIALTASDAGNLLRTIGLADSIQDGALELTARSPAGPGDTPWKGRLAIHNFTLSRAPALARVLSLASLTGVSDIMSGKGLRFNRLEMPFEFDAGRLTMTEARAAGSELGVTAKGTVDFAAARIDLEGTLIPAYTINSLLGKIPLLGALMTGIKGGGVFAATYRVKGPLAKIKISVNPLAALAPGFLRGFISGFGKVGKPADPQEQEPVQGD